MFQCIFFNNYRDTIKPPINNVTEDIILSGNKSVYDVRDHFDNLKLKYGSLKPLTLMERDLNCRMKCKRFLLYHYFCVNTR